jgi:metallo-beta-lactamase class B
MKRTMRSFLPKTLILACLLLLPLTPLRAQVRPEWTAPFAPFRIADNLYYVGSQDLAAYLVTTPAGNILINTNLTSSPPQIKASVEKLGFRWSDTKIVLVGQAHYDHVAGTAQVLRETHAKLAVMEYDSGVVESGGKTDFLHGSPSIYTFPAAHVDRVLHDGDTVTLGGVTLTAHRTGGHTRGCTTWTMRVHLPGEPAATLRNVVIIGGYSLWSDFHLVDIPGRPASYPGIADDFRHTFALYRSLPCDVPLGAHGAYFGMLEKLARMPKEGPRVWIDPAGYRTTIDDAEKSFNDYLAKQQQQAAVVNQKK